MTRIDQAIDQARQVSKEIDANDFFNAFAHGKLEGMCTIISIWTEQSTEEVLNEITKG